MAIITVVPATTMFALIVAAPIVWSIAASFHSINALNPTWEFVGIANYVELLSSSQFWSSLGNNLIWATSTSVLNTVLGTAVALLLNQNFKFKRVLTPVMLFPYLVPTAFFGYIVMWLTTQQWGLLNQLLVAFGIISRENVIAFFTGDPWTAMGTLVAVHNWKFSIFVAILVYAKLQGISDDLYEAAIMSGATKYQQFRDITLPYIKNVLFITVLLRGLWNFNMFDLIWVATNANPIDSLVTLPVLAYKIGFQFQRLGLSNTIATTLFIILSIVGIIYFKTAKPSQEVRVE
ncbi:sugar ABC transporter permease [Haloplanus salilacus]|uniref:carbohydrate ABC transporter permease n=1 Tax=Haloplanus salilacus TaxID=2949994 RepID=UPI0030CF302D